MMKLKWNKLSMVVWNETANHRQFCFISVLFHHVRSQFTVTHTTWQAARSTRDGLAD